MSKKKVHSPKDDYLDIYLSIYDDYLDETSEHLNGPCHIDSDFSKNIVSDNDPFLNSLNNQASKDCCFENIDLLCSTNQIPLSFFDSIDRHLILIYANNLNLFAGIRARLAEKLVIEKLHELGHKHVVDLNWQMARSFLLNEISDKANFSLRQHIYLLNHDIELISNGETYCYDVKSTWANSPLTIRRTKSYTDIILVNFSRSPDFEAQLCGVILASDIAQLQTASELLEFNYFDFSQTISPLKQAA